MIEVIDDEKFEEEQKRLIIPKSKSELRGSSEQIDFVGQVANSSSEFCMRARKWISSNGDAPALLPRKLSYSEYHKPPYATEVEVAKTWNYLSPSLASRPGTWARISLELVENNLIEGHYFVDGGSGKYYGKDKINRILSKNTPDEIDRCVRDIFRRLGGLIHVRGKRTTFIDCPLAKCWWRHRIACEANSHFRNFEIEDYSNLLRIASVWESLIEAMVSRLTVIGDQNIRPAIVRYLIENNNVSKENVKSLLDAVGRRSTTQALGSLDPSKVFDLIQSNVAPTSGNVFNSV